MKTAETIERQEVRKAEEKAGRVAAAQSSKPVSEARRRSLANLRPPYPKGVSGNPGGKPKVDLAAEIARAIFANDAPAIYAAFSKVLRKGNAYAFKELADRAFGRLKETHQVEVSPYKDVSDEDLVARIKRLEQELGYSTPEVLSPGDQSKLN